MNNEIESESLDLYYYIFRELQNKFYINKSVNVKLFLIQINWAGSLKFRKIYSPKIFPIKM